MQIKSRKSLNILLFGYGKMGKLIEEEALLQGHQIVAKLRSSAISYNAELPVDVAIDFSHADNVLINIDWALRYNIPLVIGTTGWDDHINQTLISKVQENAILFSPNFSIGVNIFFNLVKTAGTIFNHFNSYDVSLSEIHHNQKKDSPSGTAKKAANILLSTLNSKKKIITKLTDQIEPEELLITSQRVGNVPGTHKVLFDSLCDTIEIKHSARDRSGFAKGAIFAANWIIGKKGWLTFDDCFEDIFKEMCTNKLNDS